MELDVTVQIDGEDVLAGKLYSQAKRGVESSTFTYADSYLQDIRAFPLEPGMPLRAGSFHAHETALPRCFEDCMPDRWGRNLIMRAERNAAREERRTARTLFEGDMLAQVSDETRQGALRMWRGGEAVAPSASGVPREVSIPHLLNSADKAAKDLEADVRDLLAAGSSLGGARPKASIRDGRGVLCIAKFPKADEDSVEDVCAWEHVALSLAEKAGIRAPKTRLLRVKGRSVLLLERFDRKGGRRVPYMSALTAVQGVDGGRYSYLELAEFIEMESPDPERDLKELWRRILFTCAIGNTDDHMRNHGFLREGKGWALSPMFDVNPTQGDGEKYLSTALDFDERLALPENAMAVRDYFRVSAGEAKKTAGIMASALRGWRKEAVRNGISALSVAAMESCFESGVARLAKLA